MIDDNSKKIYIDEINEKGNVELYLRFSSSDFFGDESLKLKRSGYNGQNSASYILSHKGNRYFVKLTNDFECFKSLPTFFPTIVDYGEVSNNYFKYCNIMSFIDGKTISTIQNQNGILSCDLFYKIIKIIKSLKDTAFLIWDFNPENFILQGDNLFYVDYGGLTSRITETNIGGKPLLCLIMEVLGIEKNPDNLVANKNKIQVALLFKTIQMCYKFDEKIQQFVNQCDFNSIGNSKQIYNEFFNECLKLIEG